eukprot:7941432-Lingulodinium_polyedra.AAC.1
MRKRSPSVGGQYTAPRNERNTMNSASYSSSVLASHPWVSPPRDREFRSSTTTTTILVEKKSRPVTWSRSR